MGAGKISGDGSHRRVAHETPRSGGKIPDPEKGQKERLVELAQKNAKLVLDQDKDKIKREELRTIGA